MVTIEINTFLIPYPYGAVLFQTCWHLLDRARKFTRWHLFQLPELIVQDSFKPNSAAIVLDFLIRHNIINPDNGKVIWKKKNN